MKIATPNYVLRDEGHAVRPVVAQASAGLIHDLIFGFSDKPFYDEFASKSKLLLLPYPLVKGYLKNQLEAATGDDDSKQANANGALLSLVVVDAAGPEADVIYATTMEAILVAFDFRAKQILATHLLRFVPKSSSFQLEDIPA
ncbi:hypothetical protein N9L06_00920 [Mariniblastus sp.]|nr:hypothetical protein [Mariniblastus sp.]